MSSVVLMKISRGSSRWHENVPEAFHPAERLASRYILCGKAAWRQLHKAVGVEGRDRIPRHLPIVAVRAAEKPLCPPQKTSCAGLMILVARASSPAGSSGVSSGVAVGGEMPPQPAVGTTALLSQPPT